MLGQQDPCCIMMPSLGPGSCHDSCQNAYSQNSLFGKAAASERAGLLQGIALRRAALILSTTTHTTSADSAFANHALATVDISM